MGWKAETPAPTSRRCEEILQQGERVRQARIAAEELARLERDRSADGRAALAARFGALFEQLGTPTERELADAVLRLLARDLAKEVRQALASAMVGSRHLPHDVALQLAKDEIGIARPILQHCQMLKDEDLVEIVRAHSLQYALAVAGRAQLSEGVSDALVATGDAKVVASLVANEGARLSQGTLQRVLEDFGADADVRARLVRRPALPYELVERLLGMIGEGVERQLVLEQQLAPEQARKMMAAVRERAAIAFTVRGHGDIQLQRWLQSEHEEGRLDHERLLCLLKQGEIAALEIGIGLLAMLKTSRVRWLLYHHDRRHLAALCLAADFPMPHYLSLRMALELAEGVVRPVPGVQRGYKPATIRFLQEQYESLGRDRDLWQSLVAASLDGTAA